MENAHNLNGSSHEGVIEHLDKGEDRDPDFFEESRILFVRTCLEYEVDLFVDEFHVVQFVDLAEGFGPCLALNVAKPVHYFLFIH